MTSRAPPLPQSIDVDPDAVAKLQVVQDLPQVRQEWIGTATSAVNSNVTPTFRSWPGRSFGRSFVPSRFQISGGSPPCPWRRAAPGAWWL